MVCILNIDYDIHNDDDDNSNDINNLRIKSSRRFNSDPLAVHMVFIIVFSLSAFFSVFVFQQSCPKCQFFNISVLKCFPEGPLLLRSGTWFQSWLARNLRLLEPDCELVIYEKIRIIFVLSGQLNFFWVINVFIKCGFSLLVVL